MALERLQKVLAAGGLGSRRSCEALITAGRVTVDGRPATELGTKVDPERQEVRCDGEVVRPARNVYYLINKPKGYVCTNADERGSRLETRADRLDDPPGFVRVAYSDGLHASLFRGIVVAAGEDRVADEDHVRDRHAERLLQLLYPVGLVDAGPSYVD